VRPSNFETMKAVVKIGSSEFINREIAWLSFNERVLQEAEDDSVPLIERMRFLGIFSSNLDEFFKVRVASLRRAISVKDRNIDPMDFDPKGTLLQIQDAVLLLQNRFELAFTAVKNSLAKEGINFVDERSIDANQKKFVEHYFEHVVRPHLIPLMLTNRSAFPQLNDGSIYLAIVLGYKNKKDPDQYALIEMPESLPRFVQLPGSAQKKYVIFMDDIIRYRIRRIFQVFDFDKASCYSIKFTRDAELDIDDDVSRGVLEKMTRGLSQRKKGHYVRFTYDSAMHTDLLQFILKKIKMKDQGNIIPGGRYHNRKDLLKFPHFERADLCYLPHEPLVHPSFRGANSYFERVLENDILLFFPYHSFSSVVDILREAAIDPKVRTIRVNLYRVAHHSQVVNALINAAKNGKRVIIIIELQARFDEENNIRVTRQLQDAGIRVIAGVQGLKVHSKLIYISRKVGIQTQRLVHIGTGNFNEQTAKIYGDISLLTCKDEICNEVKKVFEFFESNYQRSSFKHLLVSPFNARRRLVDHINDEIENAAKGLPASITIKLNNLVDTALIRKLYDASQAGVHIKLIIRGISSLVPGVEGLSDNIEVISIVGRFLEHARVITFHNNGDELIYLSSADWMTRNLDHRVEVSVPIYDEACKKQIKDYLNLQWTRISKNRCVDKLLKNEYVSIGKGLKPSNAQMEMEQYLKNRGK
jgi:polyphosphate kinase